MCEIDWSLVVSDLRRAGMTQKQQGREVGVEGRTIGYLESGVIKNPSFPTGYKLIEIYQTVFGTTPNEHRQSERKDFSLAMGL